MYDIEDICKKYYNTVFKYLMSLTHDIDLSEELAQETFCIAIKEINRFKGECTICTWLLVIAKHLYYRKSKEIARFKAEELNEKDIQDVSFEEKYILKDVCLELKRGEIILQDAFIKKIGENNIE